MVAVEIVKKHPDCDSGDDTVADDAQYVRNLSEEKEPQTGGKDDLCVVKD